MMMTAATDIRLTVRALAALLAHPRQPERRVRL
jgi:hypothetical protein